ncbi:RUS family member 1 [Leguminivora glycinivorella]|uniref:RUS family member 1 n=1 Tax=Leguminivora glycinivorella TaxID=1035111 RepID=UPI00200EEBF5|nr:RUS family member 1 [Leguminivora glycinivorella]
MPKAGNEGDILLKEKYVSSSKERLYIKPPEQQNIVVLEERRFRDITNWFTQIFLPQGYPDSVSKDYSPYQVWDTAQAFCSTIAGILATQEVLRGVGVGDTNATPLAATVTWVLKDGCGHVGRIVFAFSHGTYLDAYSKKWRLYADTLNDAAMCIEIALPLFRNYTTFALCVSTVMKAIVGVAGGATRVAMTQHHAIRGNMADVSAKDSAQETAVNLIASLIALSFITVFGNNILVFIMTIILHITFNYFAVRAVCLKTLNESRFLQVIETYLKKEVIATPCVINQNEPIIFYQLGPNLLDLKMTGFQIKLGASIKAFLKCNPKAANLKVLSEMYERRRYILLADVTRRQVLVAVKDAATPDDVLCAYFHAVLLSIVTCALNDHYLPIYQGTSGYPRPFALMCQAVQASEWSRSAVEGAAPGCFAYGPTAELMRYVDKVVNKEWDRMKAGMKQTGWDLSKHLLMVDEWRISKQANATEEPPSNKLHLNEEIGEPGNRDLLGDYDVHNREFSTESSSSRTFERLPSGTIFRRCSDARVLSATEAKPDMIDLDNQ